MPKAPPSKDKGNGASRGTPASTAKGSASRNGKGSSGGGKAKTLPPPLPPSRRAAPPAPAPGKDKPGKPHKAVPAFPKKNQPPTAAAFAARLPLSLGKRFDLCRSFFLKQKGVREDVFFYGPETGWALRYLCDGEPLCSLHIHDEQPIGIVSLSPAAAAGVDWRSLSPAGQKARKQAHGSPSLLWLDVELEGNGASDFRSIVRAKLASRETSSPASGGGQAGGQDQEETD